MAETKNTLRTLLPYLGIIVLIVISSWIVYDLMFDQPVVHEGVIVKMEHVPGKMQSGLYHLGSKSRPQLISASSRDRWIATVKMEDGSLAKVDCKKHHFDNKEIGSVLRFKEFPGGSLEIKYFSHNDEED